MRCVLSINRGSSSVRFAIHRIEGSLSLEFEGKMERVGSGGEGGILKQIAEHPLFDTIQCVGHRVVHGMKRSEPQRVTAKLLAELKRIAPYDPDHLPDEIALMEAFAQGYPKLAQVACFDTAFHRSMPSVAKLLPIPRRYTRKGVERYGFHGISYAYLMEELAKLDPVAAKGRVILAHLGSGASLVAVKSGKSIETSMGFTPTAGLVMGTRTGDLDPGLFYFLARTQKMTAARFQKMVNQESGLLGVSGTSSDIRDLCALEAKDPRAAEAVELFCYQARKWIGAFAAVLGGLDTLVFSAGIGENSALIRKRICGGLGFLGVDLDATQNRRNAAVISKNNAGVAVRVIATNEELMIARSTVRLLKLES